MRRVIALFFLLIFSASILHGSELFKLPKLINHYLVHKSQSPFISFNNFIQLHYLPGETHDHPYPEDHQLPFKTISYSPANVVFAIPAPEISNEKPVAIAIEKKTIFLNAQFYQSNYKATIWQPPKSSFCLS